MGTSFRTSSHRDEHVDIAVRPETAEHGRAVHISPDDVLFKYLANCIEEPVYPLAIFRRERCMPVERMIIGSHSRNQSCTAAAVYPFVASDDFMGVPVTTLGVGDHSLFEVDPKGKEPG